MLNKLKRFIGSNEPVQHKSEEIEQQQYIQYGDYLTELRLRRLWQEMLSLKVLTWLVPKIVNECFGKN